MKLNEAIRQTIKHLHNGGISGDWLSPPEKGTFIIDGGDISLNGNFDQGDWVVILDSGQRYSGIFLLGGANYLPIMPPEMPLYSLQNGTDDSKPFDGKKVFAGAVYRLILPMGFVDLCREYEEHESDPQNAQRNVVGESESVIGGESWSVKLSTKADGSAHTWFDLNGDKLPPLVMWPAVTI